MNEKNACKRTNTLTQVCQLFSRIRTKQLLSQLLLKSGLKKLMQFHP